MRKIILCIFLLIAPTYLYAQAEQIRAKRIWATSASDPYVASKDTGGSVTAGGIWRYVGDDNKFKLQMNTAAAGDFTTSSTVASFSQYGLTLLDTQNVANNAVLTIGTPHYTSATTMFYAQRNWATGDGTASAYGLAAAAKQAPGSKNVVGVMGQAYITGAGAYTATYYNGGLFRASVYNPGTYENATTITRVSGVYSDVIHWSPSTTTVTYATGYRASLWQDDGGTTTTYRAYDVRSDQTSAGVVGTYTGFYYDALPSGAAVDSEYGIYVEAPTIATTNKIGIYNAGTQTQVGALTLGVAGATVGKTLYTNATSGSITLQPATGALGASVITLPATTGTLDVVAGLSQTVVVKGSDGNNCNLVFTNGKLTSTTCP